MTKTDDTGHLMRKLLVFLFAIAMLAFGFELNKKLETDIGNWTVDDTDEFASLTINWRARLFFPVRDRFRRTISELQRIYYETGTQPRDLGVSKITAIRESLPDGKVSWFEKAIVNPLLFGFLRAFAIVVIVIIFLNQ
jgi:hypothetical protein